MGVMSRLPVPDLGAFLREQRENAQLSLRQAAALAGVSNPYLSQIERGLRRPSAQILQRLAKSLQLSAEQVYVQAGLLEAPGAVDADTPTPASDVQHAERALRDVLREDPLLTAVQRRALLEVYRSFVAAAAAPGLTETDQTDTPHPDDAAPLTAEGPRSASTTTA